MKNWQPCLDSDSEDEDTIQMEIDNNLSARNLQAKDPNFDNSQNKEVIDGLTLHSQDMGLNNQITQSNSQELHTEEHNTIDDTIGYNTYDPGDQEPDDDGRSDYSRGSWYQVATPLPSPCSPPPERNESLSESEDEGEFQNVDVEDYRDYERWYAEDNIYEDSEMREMNDFFNSTRYNNLLHTNIVINGVDTGVPYFPGKHDIALAIMTDGIQIFDQGSSETNTCWPIMAQNLNLPPEERAQMRNLIPLGVIPGPNKPKDFDSFLVPLVKEFITLAGGIEVYNTMNGETLTLRVHPTIVSGDMQAIKYLMNFKGPNAQVPCRECLMIGCYHQGKKTYYIPLAEPLRPGSVTLQSYDAHNLPLRTDKRTAAQTKKIMETVRVGLADDLRKKYGICGPSILDRIPSLSRPSSYPHEFMHLFLLNHGPALFSLWTNTHSGISDAGHEQYLISHADLVLIGTETVGATYLIPAKFIRPFPNIESSRHLYNAELWSFWLIYIGPVVLCGRLSQKYYKHYLKFVQILKCLLQLENTTHRIKQLKQEIVEYVEEFEEYYYQYDYDRLSVCRLTLHALLHIADDVLRCGPVWVTWSFSIERYCREIVGCAKSKVVPYAAINRHVLQMAQLAATAARFPVIRRAMLFGKSAAPVKSTSMEKIYTEYPEIILRKPRLPGFPLSDRVRRRIAAYFHTNQPEWTFHAWLGFIPKHAERWGKLRIPDGGDCIRCAGVVDPLSPYGKRDSSYIRYEFETDANENYPNRDIEMVEAFGYGRLDFIIALTLPPSRKFKLKDPKLHILAHVTEAKGAEGDARTELVSFTQVGRSVILDVSSVKNVVGRVYTTGVKPSGEWYIIDRSSGACETAFHPPEHVYEDD
ncbi:hypothetical protein BN14_08130 [Rhizoctonia solani AG-1 IB]|uniref:Transposase domain-containing protein n=2 Tax=Thanatephorus cucumeris (strain AG1-IB / isolate 7/3/14) TaxID=1108050 RepID=M5C251_THACB|nr:hypothetical protein BN14_08130 [Rhizoctonia solani AG-1 IB]